jgi:hypothetical protein
MAGPSLGDAPIAGSPAAATFGCLPQANLIFRVTVACLIATTAGRRTTPQQSLAIPGRRAIRSVAFG